MTFVTPSDMPHIPTYRVMDSDGEMLDKSQERPVDVSDEEILTWYKNMMSGVLPKLDIYIYISGQELTYTPYS